MTFMRSDWALHANPLGMSLLVAFCPSMFWMFADAIRVTFEDRLLLDQPVESLDTVAEKRSSDHVLYHPFPTNKAKSRILLMS